MSNPGSGGRVVWANPSDAFFNPTGGTVTVSGTVQASSITFNNTGYIIAGTTLTLTGDTITANSDATINAPLDGSVGLTKLGAAVLTLGGVNTYTGGTTVNEGTLKLSGSGTLGSTSGSLAVNGATGGILDLGGTSQTAG